MISLEEAREEVLKNVEPGKPVPTPLGLARGHVLAEPVHSDIDLPPFNRSAMDGYAVLAADTAHAPVELAVTEDIPAGVTSAGRINSGQAAKIMTGAPVPDGADAVVMVEKTCPLEGNKIRIEEPVESGKNVAPQGQDIARGEVALETGARLGPEQIGILAMVGAARPMVFPRPRVSVLVTGDELIPVEARPTGAQIRESNGHVLAAQLAGDGIVAKSLGIVADDRTELAQKLTVAMETSDVLILSGGVSMGDRDFVPPVLAELEAQVIFHKVAIKPGKPVLFAKKDHCRIFGLPGNPVSALVVYELLIRPALRKMVGWTEPLAPPQYATLRGRLPKIIGRRQFLPARLSDLSGMRVVELLPWHGSGDMISLAPMNALAVVPEKPGTAAEGDRLEVLPRDF